MLPLGSYHSLINAGTNFRPDLGVVESWFHDMEPSMKTRIGILQDSYRGPFLHDDPLLQDIVAQILYKPVQLVADIEGFRALRLALHQDMGKAMLAVRDGFKSLVYDADGDALLPTEMQEGIAYMMNLSRQLPQLKENISTSLGELYDTNRYAELLNAATYHVMKDFYFETCAGYIDVYDDDIDNQLNLFDCWEHAWTEYWYWNECIRLLFPAYLRKLNVVRSRYKDYPSFFFDEWVSAGRRQANHCR